VITTLVPFHNGLPARVQSRDAPACAFTHWADLGIASWPLGKLIQVVGDAYVGKTTYALRVAAAAQAQQLTVGYVDADGTLNSNWSKRCGVDNGTLIYTVPRSLEQAGDIATGLTSVCDLVVWDTFSSLPTERDLDDVACGVLFGADSQLRLVGTSIIHRLHHLTAKSATVLLILCQERSVNTSLLFRPVQFRPAAPRALAELSSLRLRFSTEAVNQGYTRIDVLSSKLLCDANAPSALVDLRSQHSEFQYPSSMPHRGVAMEVFEHEWQLDTASSRKAPRAMHAAMGKT
jgi:hypothetical protein